MTMSAGQGQHDADVAPMTDDDYAKFRDEYIRRRVAELECGIAAGNYADARQSLHELPGEVQAQLLRHLQHDEAVVLAARHAHVFAQQQQQHEVADIARGRVAVLRARLARWARARAPAVLRWLLAQWPFVVLFIFEVTLLGVSRRALLLDVLLCVIFVCLRMMWNGVRIDVGHAPPADNNNDNNSSNGDADARPEAAVQEDGNVVPLPTLLGSYFAPTAGQLSWQRRLCYMVLKCVEAFVLSLSPFYSVERLEMELQRDGVVRNNNNNNNNNEQHEREAHAHND